MSTPKVNAAKIDAYTDAMKNGNNVLADMLRWKEQGEIDAYKFMISYFKNYKTELEPVEFAEQMLQLAINNLKMMRNTKIVTDHEEEK